MTTLYVSPTGSDSNNGSQGSPFRTIVAASTHTSSGDTVRVAPGNYGGGFLTRANGVAYIGAIGAVIIGAGTAANPNKAGWENRGSNVSITGFEINGTGYQAKSWEFGFYNGGSNVVIQGNRVHDILTDSSAFRATGGGAGIMLDSYYGGSGSSALRNYVYNIGPSGAASTLVHGIYLIQQNAVADDNLIYNVVGDGITSWHNAAAETIINNTIHDARGTGITVASNTRSYGSSSVPSGANGNNFLVENNIIDHAKYGIYEEGLTGKNVFTDNLIYRPSTGVATHFQHGDFATGTVFADPKFVNVSFNDFRIQATSPAIGHGTSFHAPATDILGVPNPPSGGWTIGAYNYQS